MTVAKLTREAVREAIDKRMRMLAEDAGQRRACLPDELIEYLEKPSAAQALAVLDSYLRGVTGLPLRACVHLHEPARASSTSQTSLSPVGDSTTSDFES